MPSVKELSERRGALEVEANNIVNTAETEDRDLSATELIRLGEIKEQDRALSERIQILNQRDSHARELDQPSSRNRISGRGSAVESGWGDPGDVNGRGPSGFDMAVSAFVRNAHGQPVSPEEWDAAEAAGYRPGGNGLDVLMNKFRPTLGRDAKLFGNQKSFSNSLGTPMPDKGGVLVPSGFMPSLEVALKAFGPMLVSSTVWSTEDGRPTPIPTLDDTGEAGELIAESELTPEGDMEFGALVLGSHKLTSKIIRVSQELVDDSAIDVAGEVGKALGTRLGRGANRLLTLNQTANGPRGIVPRATVGVTTASATAISADELIDLVASVDPAYRQMPGTGFMMHSDIFSYIGKLRDNYGRFLLDQLGDAQKPTLRGYPVVFNQDMSNSVTAGEKCVLFGDLAAYKVRLVRQIRLRTLTELYARNDEYGFVGFMRFDGDLLDAGTHPIKVLQQHS